MAVELFNCQNDSNRYTVFSIGNTIKISTTIETILAFLINQLFSENQSKQVKTVDTS